MMPAMRAVATATLEAPPAAITATIRTAIRAPVWATITASLGTIGTPIGTPAASAEPATITATVASPALWALEAGTWIGADAGKILARGAGIARTAGFSRQ
jgi:hypothetical protein